MKETTKDILIVSLAFSVGSIILSLIAGWVMNVVTLISMWGDEITVEGLIRIVGVFLAPIGGIAGWF